MWRARQVPTALGDRDGPSGHLGGHQYVNPQAWRPGTQLPRLAEVSFPVLLPDLPPDRPWSTHPERGGTPRPTSTATSTDHAGHADGGGRPLLRASHPSHLPAHRDPHGRHRRAHLDAVWCVYTLDLECPHPLTNPTRKDDTIEALAEGLRLLDAREAMMR